MKYNKLFWQLLLCLILLGILVSCTTLKNGKTYTVTDVRGRTVNLRGIDGDWYVHSDTVKIGDKIKVYRTRKEHLATIW